MIDVLVIVVDVGGRRRADSQSGWRLVRGPGCPRAARGAGSAPGRVANLSRRARRRRVVRCRVHLLELEDQALPRTVGGGSPENLSSYDAWYVSVGRALGALAIPTTPPPPSSPLLRHPLTPPPPPPPPPAQTRPSSAARSCWRRNIFHTAMAPRTHPAIQSSATTAPNWSKGTTSAVVHDRPRPRRRSGGGPGRPPAAPTTWSPPRRPAASATAGSAAPWRRRPARRR